MPAARVIDIARDFSRFVAGVVRSDGPWSAQQFREDLLAPALATGGLLTVYLDGTMGYGSSFLEAAFGGLVTYEGFLVKDLRSRLTLVSHIDTTLVTETWSYIDEALALPRYPYRTHE